jgi:hypothetical protein
MDIPKKNANQVNKPLNTQRIFVNLQRYHLLCTVKLEIVPTQAEDRRMQYGGSYG